jgi:peptidoglycan/xylan/chitin deacetylase (PgdA/CDA1 family)
MILLLCSCSICVGVMPFPARAVPAAAPPPIVASILVYHRFGPVVADQMTVRTATFRSHLRYLQGHGCVVIPLSQLVAYLTHEGPPLAARAVIITIDDGHRSVFTELPSVMREFQVPLTLFIYPSAISNASYAMTWEQIAALQRTGLVDIQSHTHWHPNFKVEKRRRSALDYRAFVVRQLTRSRDLLKQKLGTTPDLVAWPFGIYDAELLGLARDTGYRAGFTLDRRGVRMDDDLLALPRFLVTEAVGEREFAAMLPPEGR